MKKLSMNSGKEEREDRGEERRTGQEGGREREGEGGRDEAGKGRGFLRCLFVVGKLEVTVIRVQHLY